MRRLATQRDTRLVTRVITHLGALTIGWTAALPAQERIRAQAPLPDSANGARSGIYRTATDFLTGRLDFAIDCRRERHRVDRHTWRDRPYVDVTHAGVQTRLAKRDLFGYRDCDGTVIRFAGGHEYTVLAAATVGAIYARPIMAPAAKGVRPVTTYYFSRTAGDAVVPLTRAAVKDAFPDDHALHDRVDAVFRSDEDLAAFDARHGQYRLLRELNRAQGGMPDPPHDSPASRP